MMILHVYVIWVNNRKIYCHTLQLFLDERITGLKSGDDEVKMQFHI